MLFMSAFELEKARVLDVVSRFVAILSEGIIAVTLKLANCSRTEASDTPTTDQRLPE